MNPIMKYFDFDDDAIPPESIMIHHSLYKLAWYMENIIVDGNEKSEGLRKLLEAKDCFVRARMDKKYRVKKTVSGSPDDHFELD